MIPYSRQSISQDDIKAVKKVLKSNFLTQGPLVPKFEKKILEFVKAKYAVGVNSATSGLHLACMAIGLKKGDWLWTSVNSFVASANCGLFCGAKIDFVDINLNTYNISINSLKKKLAIAKKRNKLPKVLVPVHFAGRPCEMKEIYSLSKKYKFKIIEDASHALGSKINKENIGNCKYSDLCVFSFHPVKNITTAEGGLISTNNNIYAEKMRILRTHGINKNRKNFNNKNEGPWYYEQILLGYNYRMNDIEAALGISQFKRLNLFIKKRNQVAKEYDKKLKGLPLLLPTKDKSIINAYHLYIIRIDKSKTKKKQLELFKHLRKKNIYVNLHYIPIHYHPYFKKLGFKKKQFPQAENYYKTSISIPVYPNLKTEKLQYICKTIKIFFKK